MIGAMMCMVSRKRRWVQRDAGSRRPFLQGIFENDCRLPPSLRTPPPRDFESSGLVEAEEPPRPKCQTFARERWIAARQRELLPTRYVHVVFTLPSQFAPLALQNKKVIYDLLFRASAETLLEVARDPRHLGAELGFFT